MPPIQLSSSVLLTFLRPRALPRASTIQHFLGGSRLSTASSSPNTSALSTTSPAVHTSQPLPNVSPFPSKNSNSGPGPYSKPYTVSLTPSSNYPIYLLRKRGGNLHQTKLRKIEGDIVALRNDLRIFLGIGEKEVTINHLTKQIIIKGHKKPQVVKFLEGLKV